MAFPHLHWHKLGGDDRSVEGLNSRGRYSSSSLFTSRSKIQLVSLLFAETVFISSDKMARNPPNKPSKHRHNPKTPTSSGTRQRPGSEKNASSKWLSEVAPRTATPLSVPEQQRETTLRPLSNGSPQLASSNSTPSNSERTQIPPIPRPPESENRRRCLEPLNLGPSLQADSLLDERRAANVIDDHFMARMEVFFEQQQKFNERLEQRVTEHLRNERENLATRAPMKKRLPKELSVSCITVLF